MAQAETPEETPTESEAPAPVPGRARLKALLVLLVLSGAAAGSYLTFGAQLLDLAGGEDMATAEPLYIPLDPPFVVNLEDSELLRFLQVELQLMTRDPLTPAAIEAHLPVIRNNLLLILAAEETAALGSREGKTALQERITAEINAVLAIRAAGRRIEETYFTSFVMQ